MSLITNIAGIPLFTTVSEALAWATANGLSGYHTHNYQSQVGYMGGANHLQATGLPVNTNVPPPTTTRRVNVPPTTTRRFNPPPTSRPARRVANDNTRNTGGGSSGGGGGGGGY